MESAALSPPASEAGPTGLFAPYREDQGRHARMAAFWTLVFFLGFGCRFLHDILIRWDSLREPLGGIRVPVVSVNLSPAFLVSGLLFLGGLVLIQHWQKRPKMADLLIDTEAELRKVHWPSGEEVWNASIVVIVSVVLLGLLLAFADVLLFRLMRALILRGS